MSEHWLVRPATIRRLWQGFVALLVLTLVAERFVEAEPHFDVERMIGGYALYGFFACAVLILFARLLAVAIKRPQSYYEEREQERRGD